MRSNPRLLLFLAALGAASCETTPEPVATIPRSNTVEIAQRWRLEGGSIDYEVSQVGRQVLRAAAQNGARLVSLVPPLHTRVSTVVEADEIYYNAFFRRFDLFGDITVRQGQVVDRGTPATKWVLFEDGELNRDPDQTLATSAQTLSPTARESEGK